ncbi:LPXTG cell wall anchor domain-containing protein [Glutamicibacter soli]
MPPSASGDKPKDEDLAQTGIAAAALMGLAGVLILLGTIAVLARKCRAH